MSAAPPPGPGLAACRWVRMSSPGRASASAATPAAGRPHARPGGGYGPRKSHLHGVSVGGAVPAPARRAGDARGGMGQEGCAGRGPPPPPPPPQSGPPASRGENLPAPADLRRSALLRVSCSPPPAPPGGCTGRAPHPRPSRNPHNYGGPVAPLNLVVDLAVLRPPLGK